MIKKLGREKLFIITKQFEKGDIIIYKRTFDLRNCCGSKRYFEVSKTNGATGKEFRSITQVKKYIVAHFG